MTVIASAASKRFAAKGRPAASATRSAMGVRRAVSRHKARARSSRRRLASMPTRPPLHDVGLTNRVLDELVGEGAARRGSGQPDPAQERQQQRDGDDQEQENRKKPHATQRSGLIDTARRNSLS